MSFEKPFKNEKKIEIDLSKCSAYGCPCRATISIESGRFLCAYHAFEPSQKWQELTRRLRDHEWLNAFISDVQKMDQTHQKWREFSLRFWDRTDDFCAPDPREEATPYCNRMRAEMGYRVGVNASRPTVRLPKAVAPRGQFARGIGLEAEAA